MNQSEKLGVAARIVAAILLIVAIPEGWPYGYFVFLRWVVAASAVLIVIHSYQNQQVFWVSVFVLVAILFNPIAPIHLNKETWVILDALTALLFIVSFFAARKSWSKQKQG